MHRAEARGILIQDGDRSVTLQTIIAYLFGMCFWMRGGGGSILFIGTWFLSLNADLLEK